MPPPPPPPARQARICHWNSINVFANEKRMSDSGHTWLAGWLVGGRRGRLRRTRKSAVTRASASSTRTNRMSIRRPAANSVPGSPAQVMLVVRSCSLPARKHNLQMLADGHLPWSRFAAIESQRALANLVWGRDLNKPAGAPVSKRAQC